MSRKTYHGNITVVTNNLGPTEEATKAFDVETVNKIEQYLNDEVAVKVFRKFGAMIRIHIKEK